MPQRDIDITSADLIQAFMLGFWESEGDAGLTYDNDPESPRSRAYDMGRDAYRKLFAIEDEEGNDC